MCICREIIHVSTPFDIKNIINLFIYLHFISSFALMTPSSANSLCLILRLIQRFQLFLAVVILHPVYSLLSFSSIAVPRLDVRGGEDDIEKPRPQVHRSRHPKHCLPLVQTLGKENKVIISNFFFLLIHHLNGKKRTF